MASQLSLNAHNILTRIAGGHTYEQILRELPHLTRQDIFSAASEALMILGIESTSTMNAPASSPVETPAEPDNSDDFSSVIIQPGS